jgi:regulator of G protein signaling-like protein
MPIELDFHDLTVQQHGFYLDLILRNRSMYDDFLTFADSRGVGESVRFLRTMTEIPWNGNTPMTPDMARGIYATYIREGSFLQINIAESAAAGIREAVDSEQPADWGPIVNEIRRLLRYNGVVKAWLTKREKDARARLGAQGGVGAAAR